MASVPSDRRYLPTHEWHKLEGDTVTGTVTEVNAELTSSPGLVNTDPYDKGWMVRVKAAGPAEVNKLLPLDDYLKAAGH